MKVSITISQYLEKVLSTKKVKWANANLEQN